MRSVWFWVIGGLTLAAIAGGGIVAGHAVLTAKSIYDLAVQAGFQGIDAVYATAIALAESGGNPNAHGDQSLGSGRGSFGLWQIYSDAHPEFGPDFTKLFDPLTNAIAAFQVYQEAGNSFRPWSTFKNNAYQAYVAGVSEVAQA